MSTIKKLAGQTVIYGLSSIVGRLLNYFLVPLYTYVMATNRYGSVTEFYSYSAFILVVLTYGMETAFFRFNESEENKNRVFSTSFISLLFTTFLFVILLLIFKNPLAELIRYPNQSYFVLYLGLMLAFDALTTLPFARLRAQNRPLRFAIFKSIGIIVNIGLNLLMLLAVPAIFPEWKYSDVNEYGVSYILLANVASSGIMFLLFVPDLLKIKWEYDKALLRRLLVYALPLLIFGLAGSVNEVFDRILLKYLLPENTAMSMVGIYGACYKVSIIMTIFIQAYKYAAEPFFFSYEKNNDAKTMYANMMHYFIIITALIFLVTALYLDLIIYFVGEKYRVGQNVIPVLLLANLFLGVYYNLSIWYKLTNQTKFGAYISLFGAVLTLVLNFIWIPIFNYTGSAWATFACYGSMMVISYFLGQKYYPVPYKLSKDLLILIIAIGLYYLSTFIRVEKMLLHIGINSVLFILFIVFLAVSEKQLLIQLSSAVRRRK